MSVQTIMIIAFTAATVLAAWKLYAFLPNKPLPDDDSNEASKEELTTLMLEVIEKEHRHEAPLTAQELFEQIVRHEAFDKEHYWRFNRNKLNQLLQRYYLHYPHTGSIPAIYDHLRGTTPDTDRQEEQRPEA